MICGLIAFGITEIYCRLFPVTDNLVLNNGEIIKGFFFKKYFPESPKKPVCKRRIVGYFSEIESTEISKSQIDKLTHAVFAFVRIKYDGTLQFDNSKADLRFSILKDKTRGSNVEMMVSIGGGYENAHYFASALSDSQKKKYIKFH